MPVLNVNVLYEYHPTKNPIDTHTHTHAHTHTRTHTHTHTHTHTTRKKSSQVLVKKQHHATPPRPPNPPASTVGSGPWPLAASRRIPPRRAGNPQIPLPTSVPGWGFPGTRLGGWVVAGFLLVKGGFLVGLVLQTAVPMGFLMDGLDRFWMILINLGFFFETYYVRGVFSDWICEVDFSFDTRVARCFTEAWTNLKEKLYHCLVIQSDLFGMVKWPFQGVKWPPTRGWKGHFESPVLVFWWFSCW